MDIEDPTHGQDAPASNDGGRTTSSHLTQVTRAMVGIYKEQFGRGPRFAHSHYAGANAVVCFLEGTLTPVERALANLGQHERLRDIRLLFQYAAELEFRGAVEQILDRRVIAFISGIDVEADIASEMFLLG